MSPGDEPKVTGIPERLGDFRLLERLGAGGMGVVYLARQESLSRDIALKLILPEHLYFAEARERFRREVEAAAKLRHPGIVPIYTVGEEGGLPYYAMELVEGASLGDVLEHLRGRRPSELSGEDLRQAILSRARSFGDASSTTSDGSVFAGTWVQACCRIVLQVADALHHAHERGVLHRDVKPSNVVLTPSGRAMLLDFGLASTTESSRITRTGAQMGSLPYMPPECLRGGTATADRRADVYSLGVSFYEMLALHLPFEAPTIQQVMAAISSGDAPPLRERNPSVPKDAAIVCASAMERDHGRRYPTAEAFAGDLRNLLELRPIEAHAASTTLRARRWVQRHTTASVTMFLGFLLLVVAPSVGWWRIRKERDVALRELQAKEEILGFLLDLFDAGDPDLGDPGNRTVYDLIEEGSRRIQDAFQDLPQVRGQLLIDLAVIHHKLGHPREAIALARESLALLEPIQGEDGGRVVAARRVIALELLQLGEIDEAEQMFEKVRASIERVGSVAGITLTDLRMDFAAAMILGGRIDDAERILNEVAALPGWELEATPQVRILWHTNMGHVHRSRGDIDASAGSFGRALELSRSTYGGVHESVAKALQDLAVARVDAGRNEEAMALYLEAREVRSKLGVGESMQDARLEFNLGFACGRLGRPSESAEHYGRALELSRRLAGDSAQTAKVACGMGSALFKAGKYEDAEKSLTEALDLSRRFIPRRGFAAAEAPLWLARVLVKLERGEEAEPLYAEVTHLIEDDPFVKPDLGAKIEGEYAEVLRSLGKEADAAPHLERQRALTEQASAKTD